MANITARVYVSVTLVGILSARTSWNKLTASMRTYHVPALFIFTLDITLKYISVLGEMAEEMYAAMCCRGFTGEYEKKQKYEPCVSDIFYILIMVGCAALFIYLNKIAA